MNGSCLCGAVTVEVPGPPEEMNQCNCIACTKLGAVWGYYRLEEVRVDGAPLAYRRDDAEGGSPLIEFQSCATCGATVRWRPTEHFDSPRTGINMMLFDPVELDGVPVRYGERRTTPMHEPRRTYRPNSRFNAVEARP